MNSSTAQQIVLAARPSGKLKLTDFRLEKASVPAPSSNQIQLEVQYLSLDPYMRGRMDERKSYAKSLRIGDVMTGEGVARVIASNRPDYSVGDIVLAQTAKIASAIAKTSSTVSSGRRKFSSDCSTGRTSASSFCG